MASRYKRPASAAERATRDAAREEKLTALHEQLTEQVAALRSGEDWRAWLDVASRFHTYSFNNTLLIYAQRPDARAVAGYSAWQVLGRQVDKGEKGIQILAPVTRRAPTDLERSGNQRGVENPPPQGPSSSAANADPASADDVSTARRVVGFRVAYVWDVDQTSGDLLPERPRPELLAGQAPEGLWDSLAGLAEARGFTVERGNCGPAHGWTNYTSRTVRIRPDVDDAQAVKTLAHEMGHVLLHDRTDFASDPVAPVGGPDEHATTESCRGVKEVEAESVAYLVGTTHGLATDSYTFPYVAGWAGSVDATEPERVVAATGQRVLRAVGTVLDATEGDRTAAGNDEQLAAQVTAGRDRAAAVRTHAESTQATAAASTITSERRAVLIAMNDEATRWYADQLASSPPDHGPRAYLADRGLDRETLDRYRVGYALARWTGLTDHLRVGGYSDDAIEESGLATRSRHGNLVDRFRDRIMLPVADEAGAVVGFVGRAAATANIEVPKYINSPETPLYRKSDLLFGLIEVRDALATGARPVIAEGPFDAIAVTAAGAGRYAGVAPCGTALTEAQVAALDRAAPLAERGVVVAFDGDEAGRTAAARAYGPLQRAGAWPTAAELPDGQDPAGFFRAAGPDALTAALDTDRPLADILVDQRLASYRDRLGTVEGRVLATRAAADVVATMPGEHVGRQAMRLTRTLGVDHHTVTREVADAITRHGAAAGRLGRWERRDDLTRAQAATGLAENSVAALAFSSYPRRAPAVPPTSQAGPTRPLDAGVPLPQRPVPHRERPPRCTSSAASRSGQHP